MMSAAGAAGGGSGSVYPSAADVEGLAAWLAAPSAAPSGGGGGGGGAGGGGLASAPAASSPLAPARPGAPLATYGTGRGGDGGGISIGDEAEDAGFPRTNRNVRELRRAWPVRHEHASGSGASALTRLALLPPPPPAIVLTMLRRHLGDEAVVVAACDALVSGIPSGPAGAEARRVANASEIARMLVQALSGVAPGAAPSAQRVRAVCAALAALGPGAADREMTYWVPRLLELMRAPQVLADEPALNAVLDAIAAVGGSSFATTGLLPAAALITSTEVATESARIAAKVAGLLTGASWWWPHAPEADCVGAIVKLAQLPVVWSSLDALLAVARSLVAVASFASEDALARLEIADAVVTLMLQPSAAGDVAAATLLASAVRAVSDKGLAGALRAAGAREALLALAAPAAVACDDEAASALSDAVTALLDDDVE